MYSLMILQWRQLSNDYTFWHKNWAYLQNDMHGKTIQFIRCSIIIYLITSFVKGVGPQAQTNRFPWEFASRGRNCSMSSFRTRPRSPDQSESAFERTWVTAKLKEQNILISCYVRSNNSHVLRDIFIKHTFDKFLLTFPTVLATKCHVLFC